MATRESIEQLKGNTDYQLGGTLFVVGTRHFGYYCIPKGFDQYYVIEEGGDLSIHKVEAEYDDLGDIVFDIAKAKENAPIIRVIDGDVFYTSMARQDPYQHHFHEISSEAPGETIDKVIDAFSNFVKGNYQTGTRPYIAYYRGDLNYDTGIVTINGPVEEEAEEPLP